jgi:hypothetical protein
MKRRSNAIGKLPRARRISAATAGRRGDLPLLSRVAVGWVGSSLFATREAAFLVLAAACLAAGFAALRGFADFRVRLGMTGPNGRPCTQ